MPATPTAAVVARTILGGCTGAPAGLASTGACEGGNVATSPNACVSTWEVGPDVPSWESGMGVTSGLLPMGRVGASMGMADPAMPGAAVWGVWAWTDATSKTAIDRRERVMVECWR